MKHHLLLPTLFLAAALGLSAQTAPPVERTPQQWAIALAESELARRGPSLEYAEGRRSRWDYTSGIFALALQRVGEETGRPELVDAGNRIVHSFLTEEGGIRTYKREDYNIDNITPGRALLWEYKRRPTDKARKAIELLKGQMDAQPRTNDGGFWHKQRYPYQMWLDGLYMASPFLASYGTQFGYAQAYDEVAKQILLVDRHTYDPVSGLFYHGWDEARAQSWADKQTGRSPSFWGRAVGWYAMALVDVLDELPPTHPEVDAINDVLHRLAAGIARHQDPESGVWYQVLDQPKREGNYREASATAMFVYTLAKGLNRGYLPVDTYGPVLERAYAGMIREFARDAADGKVDMIRVVEVSGLGYTSSSGRPRDGSFDYYMSEPVISNDLKGVGPFIFACLEMQRWRNPKSTPAAQAQVSPAERIAKSVVAPSIPARSVSIVDHGAKPGERIDAAVRAGLAALQSEGGGRLVVPAGEWLSGPIHLGSRTELHVEKGAVIRFSTTPADYLPAVFTRWEGMECWNYSPLIYAIDQTDVAVTGEGVLDGGASEENWWAWKKTQRPHRDQLFEQAEAGVPVAERRWGEGSLLRPNFAQFYRCSRVLVQGVTFKRSPMWVIHPVLCTDVTVRGVTVNSHGPNSDGCNPESSRRVLIEDCLFDTGDDCIAIKSGRNNDGRRLNVPSEEIVIRRCVMKEGHGGVVIGSEISGGAREIYAHDIHFDSPNLDRALRIKTNARRGGVIENVFLSDSTVGRVAEAVVTIDLQYEEGAKGDYPPIVRNIQLRRVNSTASPRVLMIAGFPAATIDRIRISESNFAGLTESDVVSYVKGINFDRVSVQPLNPAKTLNSVKPPSSP